MGTWVNDSAPPRIVAAIFCHLLFVSVLFEGGLAQSIPVPPSQTISLTLKDAVQLALKQNPRVGPATAGFGK